MTDAGRRYQVYCDIARTCLGREPLTRAQWDAIPRRSYFRSATQPRHDDAEFDYQKDQQGDAQ